MKKIIYLLSLFFVFACKSKVETIKVEKSAITESIYASGIIKSKNQYQLFPTVTGIIEQVYVEEGDSVKVGTPLFSIANEAQQYAASNAALAARYSDIKQNQDKLYQAKVQVELAKAKLKNDSMIYMRQLNLWQKQVGSKMELELRELAFQNSKSGYSAALVSYMDLKRQVELTSAQSENNLKISNKLENDFTLKSQINGIVYALYKVKGELVSLQTPLAVIGDATQFILEMQVDENDILKVKLGQQVLISMDSYKGSAFEAKVTKINPYMNERSKTFLVEAAFVHPPEKLFPNVNFEANIVIQTKTDALLVPRAYLLNDSTVVNGDGEKVVIKTGLKDYQKVEVLSGLAAGDVLMKPTE